MVKKSKHPLWFKLWLRNKPMIDAVPDAEVGRALKAVLHYFETGEIAELGQLEAVVFASMKVDVDDAFSDYKRDVENGKKGGRPKKVDEEKPPVKEGNQPLPTPPQVEVEEEVEEEVEVEVDVEEKGEGKPAPNSPPPTKKPKKDKPVKHKYGEYNNVLLTDEELDKLKAEYSDWEDRIERLSSYVASTGKTYKSHYATIRNWARKDAEQTKNTSRPKQSNNLFMDMLNEERGEV